MPSDRPALGAHQSESPDPGSQDPDSSDPNISEGQPATPPGGRRRFAGVTNLWRLRSYLRPYTGRLVLMLLAALVGVGASLSIPLVTKEIIDGPIAHREVTGLILLGLLAAGLGITEAF